MIKQLLPLLIAITGITAASATQRLTLDGVDYDVDTVYHAQVGPGTTQTTLYLTPIGQPLPLRVFYCAIDLTNPYVSLSAVCATDKVAGNETISGMARRKSREGAQYFAGINGDFFLTGGKTSRGVSVIGTPVGATVCDGLIYRARNNASQYKNFLVDTEGKVYCNPFVFGGTLSAPSGATAHIGGVNTYSDEASCANSIVVFTDRYYGSTDQTNAGVEIQARLAEGSTFAAAGTCTMVITGEPSTDGDMTIPDGGFVLRGVGTAAAVLQALQPGDEVQLAMQWTFGDLNVTPAQVISGNPKIVGNGQVLNTEGERGDASARHPRSAVGVSADGKTAYFLVVDGRSTLSAGARTSVVGELIRRAGAAEAINVDGGGSSILYTQALGKRNVPSDGNERADANAIYAVHSAPTDNTLAALQYVDWELKVPKYGVYTPKVYGYNQYGVLLDTDVRNYRLSCPEELGIVRDDTVFVATGSGTGLLTVSVGDVSFSAPLTIIGSGDALAMRCESVINDGYRPWPVEVQSQVDGKWMPVDPSALQWSSSDDDIVAIDPETGVMLGLRDGEATVTGTLGNFVGTTAVTVQIPTSRAMPLDRDFNLDNWALATSGGKDFTLEKTGDCGVNIHFTGASARTSYIRLSRELQLWSLPDTIRLSINPGEAPITAVSYALNVPGGAVTFQKVTPESLPAGQLSVIDLPLDSWIDTGDMLNFPITLNYIQLAMNRTTTGQEYDVEIPAIELIYAAVPEQTITPGDVNRDGNVNAGDVSAIYSVILGTETDPAIVALADLNADSYVNAGDISALYALILAPGE